jgi:hypothetical protein
VAVPLTKASLAFLAATQQKNDFGRMKDFQEKN